MQKKVIHVPHTFHVFRPYLSVELCTWLTLPSINYLVLLMVVLHFFIPESRITFFQCSELSPPPIFSFYIHHLFVTALPLLLLIYFSFFACLVYLPLIKTSYNKVDSTALFLDMS